jgi:hypothetical protein
MGKMVCAGAGAGIFDKPELEPHKNGPAPQYCCKSNLLPFTRMPILFRIQGKKRFKKNKI